MSCKQEISSPSAVLPVISTSNPPRREIGSDDAPSILDWRGRRVSWWIPRSVRVETGQTAIWAPVSITVGVVVDLVGFLILLEKVGGARPSCLYDGRCNLIVRERSGFLRGRDFTHPWWISWSMCGRGKVRTLLVPQAFISCTSAAKWRGVVGMD